MVRMEIALSRFKWKPAPWMRPENIRALWIYCNNGALSYELELEPGTDLPKIEPRYAPNSKNLGNPNFVRVNEPRIIQAIENRILELDVGGARARGIVVGEITIPLGTTEKKVLAMSTLKDWKDWMENKRNFKR